MSPEETASSNLQQYLRRVHDRHSKLDMSLFQSGQERDFSFVSLDTFYVPLRIAGRSPFEEDGRNLQPERMHEGDILSTQLLAPGHRLNRRSRHLTMLGDAGSGKTTILRCLVGALAQAHWQTDKERVQELTGWTGDLLIPFFIPLRHFHHFCANQQRQAISRRSFFHFLSFYFAEHDDLELSPDFYRQVLRTGNCLVALDGFDEVPGEDDRRQVVQVVRALAGDNEVGQNRIILSSRVAAYGGSTQLGGQFQTLWVQNLNREERRTQVEKWVEGITPYSQRQLQAEDVLKRMPDDGSLDRLAVTPMIVTALCVVYFYDHKLPQQRARLYRRCIDIMLGEKLRPDDPGLALAELAGSPDFKRELLARLAYHLHESGQDTTDREQAAHWLKDGFKSAAEAERLPTAREFLDTITVRGALLQERDGAFGFGRQHLTFREFLVGYHLSLNLRARQRRALWSDLLPDDRWREPIRLAVGATMPDNMVVCEDVLEELLEVAQAAADNPALRLAGHRLAAESLLDLGEKERQRVERELQTEIIQGLADCLSEEAVVDPAAGLLPERVMAAATLGELGDPRPGVTTLPPKLTEPIGGQFMFGENNEPRTVEPFAVGIYPVTNAQYEQFMGAGGYGQEAWWSEAGWEWRQGKLRYDWQKMGRPDFEEDTRFNQPNQPVVGVTYYEAEAFCRWLSETFGREYRLPTEEEWEALARGAHGRTYPWGNEWREGLANTKEAELEATCAVGLFPGGSSPHGVFDCAGNVFEWCATWWDEETKRNRVLKGGCWGAFDKRYARCGARYLNSPGGSNNYYGFRVVAPIS
ncbi:MAG: SUMF1/EgtB/PvdO family nonheme iron enzyme [Chloroflexi bacterium]|nr:SUMF1/EgtB/PvdO family nonheme iron enzyme [Chloroflexota bacterium]